MIIGNNNAISFSFFFFILIVFAKIIFLSTINFGDRMKKIYWFIQQCEDFGGTEMVTLQIISSLVDDYDITLVVSSKKPEKYVFAIPDKVKQVYLGYKHDEIKMDSYLKQYKEQGKLLKAFGLILRVAFNALIKRFFVRRKIRKMTKEDDILIASSLDNYMIMPRGRNVFYHYHFNAKFFFSPAERLSRLLIRKPNKWIFLSESTRNEVEGKIKKYRNKTVSVLNPIRYEPILDLNYYNNEFIFVGRFMEQKNPMMLLEAMKYLKEYGNKFRLHMFGDGPYKSDMLKYINDNNLSENILIKPSTINIGDEYKNKDLILVSSLYEGFCLVMIEANSRSTPVVSTNWGDAVYERIENGKNGYIVESFSAEVFAKQIHEVINNKEKLMQMREQSFEMSKNYSIDKISQYWKENILK